MDFTEIVTKFGRWHIFRLAFVLANISFFSQYIFTMPFLAPNIPHYCSRPDNLVNVSSSSWRDLHSQINENNGAEGNCKMYKQVYSNISEEQFLAYNFSSGETVSCESWDYDTSFYVNTLTSKWNLVCDRDYLISIANSIGLFGLTFSVIIMGQFSDRFGRKPVILIGTAIWIAASFAILIVNDYVWFVFLRFVCLSMAVGTSASHFVLCAECLNAKDRSTWGNASGFGYSFGLISLPLWTYLLRDWFLVQVTISAPIAIYFLLIMLTLPESPRWLLLHEKYEKCEKVLKQIIRTNKLEISENEDLNKIMMTSYENMMENEKSREKKHFLALLKTPELRKRTLSMLFAWFVTTYIYISQTLHVGDLGGNAFTNFAISGGIEFPSSVFSILICQKFGRKKPMLFVMAVSALSAFATILVPEDLNWLRITLIMISKFAIRANLPIIHVYTSEVFPTPVRNVGFGACSIGRVGTALAPYAKEIALLTNRHIPQAIVGALATLCCLASLVLPETSNKKLPETIEEIEKAKPDIELQDRSP